MCDVRHCRGDSTIVYLDHCICEKHWLEHCNDFSSFNLKVEFNIIDEVKENEVRYRFEQTQLN